MMKQTYLQIEQYEKGRKNALLEHIASISFFTWRKYFVTFICLSLVHFVKSQVPTGLYESREGHVVITGKINNSPVIAESNNLIILLNCDNSEVLMRINFNTINTGVYEYDKMLGSSTGFAIYKGKIRIGFIESKMLTPVQFDAEGILTINSIGRPVTMRSGINYLGGDNSGILSGNFSISLFDFNLLHMMPSGTADELLVQFSQVVMRRVCE